ncbi:MAG: CDP-alcohol phosphatidyltransferase family protein [Candidatus Aenigmatarchaeota archaeon]
MFFSSMRRHTHCSDMVSIAGAIFALLAVFLALEKFFLHATVFIIVSLAMDTMDGKFARAMKRKGDYGVILDLLCDVVLYLMAIVIFGYSVGLNSVAAIMIYILFVITGVMRLARSGVIKIVDSYEGLPVTYTIAIPIAYFVLEYCGLPLDWLLWLYLIPSFLMIASFKIRKI